MGDMALAAGFPAVFGAGTVVETVFEADVMFGTAVGEGVVAGAMVTVGVGFSTIVRTSNTLTLTPVPKTAFGTGVGFVWVGGASCLSA